MFLSRDTKSPYYQVIYFVNGKRTKISTKTTDKREAEKFLKSFTPKPKEKKVEPEEPKEKKVSIKLSSFVKEYKTYVSNTYSEKYLKKAVKPSFAALQKHIKDIPLIHISTRIIDQFISSASASSKHSASLYHRTLKAAFNKAVVWNYLEANPFDKIKAPKVPQSFPVFISESELILILNNTQMQLMKDIFTTAFYTGMRLGELVNMKWNWIDFTENIITVKNSSEFNSKNKRERIIPIHQKVQTILKNRYQLGKFEDALVFSRYEGIKLNEDFVSKQFKKAVRAAKLNDKIHFHTIRHSFASALVQRGISLYAVKELLGHGNIKTTQIYSHLQKDNLREAVNLL
ncbi:tyrosine-type recombinase/integrase [Melioribacter sp. OK-6-Me]|uniref:tyrosine-type recombinase/integrase n=1 Tax=unclassified Melioribacter TaxID=2627329 RepID=UPI003ED93101